MKIHMEAVTLLSVLFATSSVFAADDAQQKGRRLKPRKGKNTKKSKKTDAPTSTPTAAPTSTPTEELELSSTVKLRVVLDNDPIVLLPSTAGGSPSFIGSRSVITGRGFFRGPEGGEFPVEQLPELVSLRYAQICTVTEGTFPPAVIEESNCDISLCLDVPFFGGCAFYKSGGNFPFTIGEPVPTVVATKTGGTGVVGFDTNPGFLTIFSAGTVEFIDVDLTSILPGENSANFKRNAMLAETVPGFCPSEAGGNEVCLEGIPEGFDICELASLVGNMC